MLLVCRALLQKKIRHISHGLDISYNNFNVCLALVILGVALGPLYPSTVALASKTIPLRLYATSVGFLSAVSQ